MSDTIDDETDEDTEPASEPRPHWLDERFLTIGERGLLDRPAPPRECLLWADGRRGLLPAGKVGMVAAEGGAGKTWALVQLAVAVATGTPWLGTYTVDPKRRGKVLLLLAEEDEREFHFRLERVCQDLPQGNRADVASNLVAPDLYVENAGDQGDDVGIALMRSADEVHRGGGRETGFSLRLTHLVQELGPWSLIVFDPLVHFASGDTEKDNIAASRMLRRFQRFTHAPGSPTVLFTHHTTKSSRAARGEGATAARGASALNDNARWQARLEPREDYDGAPRLVNFRVVKNNYPVGPRPETLVLFADPDRGLRPASSEHIGLWQKAHEAAKAAVVTEKKRAGAGAGKPAPSTHSDDDDDDDDPVKEWLR
jgi:hypothetical protein